MSRCCRDDGDGRPRGHSVSSFQNGVLVVDDPFRREDERVRDTLWMIEKCRDLGGVDLDRSGRTIGFERRPLGADRRPRAAPAWGVAPVERE